MVSPRTPPADSRNSADPRTDSASPARHAAHQSPDEILFSFRDVTAEHLPVTAEPDSHYPQSAQELPHDAPLRAFILELARAQSLRKLRATFKTLSREFFEQSPPGEAFNAWLFSQYCTYDLDFVGASRRDGALQPPVTVHDVPTSDSVLRSCEFGAAGGFVEEFGGLVQRRTEGSVQTLLKYFVRELIRKKQDNDSSEEDLKRELHGCALDLHREMLAVMKTEQDEMNRIRVELMAKGGPRDERGKHIILPPIPDQFDPRAEKSKALSDGGGHKFFLRLFGKNYEEERWQLGFGESLKTAGAPLEFELTSEHFGRLVRRWGKTNLGVPTRVVPEVPSPPMTAGAGTGCIISPDNKSPGRITEGGDVDMISPPSNTPKEDEPTTSEQNQQNKVNKISQHPLLCSIPESHHAAFIFDCLLLLFRYRTLFGPGRGEGRGWQLGTPPRAMEAKKVQCELFASPLNAHLDEFCSVYGAGTGSFSGGVLRGFLSDDDLPPIPKICEDALAVNAWLHQRNWIDSLFGSRGSFFSEGARAIFEFGKLECGPIYDPFVMEEVSKIVLETLERKARFEKGDPPHSNTTTVVFVLPDWECPAIRALLDSEFLIRSRSLVKESHRYRNGFQHSVGKKGHEFVWGECASLLMWLGTGGVGSVSDEEMERVVAAWGEMVA